MFTNTCIFHTLTQMYTFGSGACFAIVGSVNFRNSLCFGFGVVLGSAKEFGSHFKMSLISPLSLGTAGASAHRDIGSQGAELPTPSAHYWNSQFRHNACLCTSH